MISLRSFSGIKVPRSSKFYRQLLELYNFSFFLFFSFFFFSFLFYTKLHSKIVEKKDQSKQYVDVTFAVIKMS
jgi:hypothetical protein